MEKSSEEEDKPVPVAVVLVVSAFMDTAYDEVRAEYFSSLKDHVGDLLLTCPEFIEILQSNKNLCVDPFVLRSSPDSRWRSRFIFILVSSTDFSDFYHNTSSVD